MTGILVSAARYRPADDASFSSTPGTLRPWLCLVFLLAVLGGAAQPATAQQDGDQVPRIDEAEAIFRQALDAFDAQDYGMAFRRFRIVYEAYPLHRKTTAAILMAGKALYRDGDAVRAAELLTEFVRAYPTSGYQDEARRTLELAERKLRGDQEAARVLRLGIALPLNPDEAPLTQALFNGIRLAVEAHNRTEDRAVQMIFRDTRNSQIGARQAVSTLTGTAGVDVILGPLYSNEAEAAAGAAESAGVVLVAPLATDEGVARGRRYVFQANPTIVSRGVLMARLAVEDLGARAVGVAAERGNSISERMAEGFQEEALRLGADVAFFELLPSSRDWGQLSERVGPEALRAIDALYLPVSGRNAGRSIEAALNSLDRANVSPRVLGNSEWDGLASKRLASAFGVVYTEDFFVDEADAAVEAFDRDYRRLAGQAPGRLAYVGYDVARFLLAQLTRADGASLPEALRRAEPYQGLGTRIDFRQSNANEAIFFLRFRNDEAVLYR